MDRFQLARSEAFLKQPGSVSSLSFAGSSQVFHYAIPNSVT